jgi:hypothetical protein
MSRRIVWIGIVAVGLGLLTLAVFSNPDRSAGRIEGPGRGQSQFEASQRASLEAAAALTTTAASPAKSVLFGDLHVHSTFSIDAFAFALPIFGGEGAHPPADACDFARYCSSVDFYSLNDHAEGLTPARWQESIESVRQCNALAGDPANPDLVAFMGWEWTQVGDRPESHYGHRNVIFRGLADSDLPTRPISALPAGITNRARALWLVRALERLGPLGLGEYADFLWLTRQIAETPDCPSGVDPRALPADCRENAATPAELFAKLESWDTDYLVIPHGLAWGIHAPPGSGLDTLLRDGNHDPARERLVEIFSGHGNGEEYRDALPDAEAGDVCPAPTADHLACCWQAGEIMRGRCGDLPEAECEQRVEEARRIALEAAETPHRTFPDTTPEDWLDCDQCRDCFKPAMNLRPRQTAQYSLAVSRFAEDDASDAAPGTASGAATGPATGRFRWGFIASTDNHTARPATGYKQYDRHEMTDARGMASPALDRLTRPFIAGRPADPPRAQPGRAERRSFQGLFDVERQASFMYPGGLVAVHAESRDRHSIWDALGRREVYGTSGPRILLWFDLLNAPGGPAAMGSEVSLATAPEFEVRAAGAFQQLPGCPETSHSALSPARLERLCRGECDHPGDERHPIAAIEIVRVRPQMRPGEPVETLIDDPWRRFECPADPAGCSVRFSDPDFVASGRSAVYYARVLQAATPAINAANLRTEFDAAGFAVSVDPCHGSYRTSFDDDCLAPAQERAWSSPIFVEPAAAAPAVRALNAIASPGSHARARASTARGSGS